MKDCRVKQLIVIGFALFVAAVLYFIMTSCATIKLEKKLSPEVRAWLRVHESLMQTEVPYDVAQDHGTSERTYFLRLPNHLQIRYQEMFWKIRDGRAREVFESRLEYINHHLSGQRRSAMADLILLCGLPEEIYVFAENGKFIGMGNIQDNKGYYHVISLWHYYYRGRMVVVGFENRGNAWYEYAISAPGVSERAKMERYWRVFFSPTWVGWDEWREIIGNDKP